MPNLATAWREVAARPAVPRVAGSRLVTVLSLAVLTVLAAIYAGLFIWLSLGRYWSYQSHALDLGNMGQAAWNTIHGYPFQFTNMRLPYNIEAWNTTTRLSFHVEALFPLISLSYLLYPHPETLLVLQTLAIALGVIPVYLLSRDILQNEWLGVVFAIAYLLFPTLEAMNLYEFHPVALATPLLLFAFLFAWRRQNIPFVLCCAAAIGTKEQIGLTVAMFGLYVAIVNRDWKVGLGVAFAGVLWSLLSILVVEKHYRLPGTVTYLHTRYGYFGHGIGSALRTITHDPGVIGNVLFSWPKLGYLERLFGPVGYLALLAPPVLIMAAPTLALNLLSTDFHMYSGLGDNSAELVAIVIIAAIFGAAVTLRLLRRAVSGRTASIIVAAYVVITALWSQHANGFTPLGSRYQAATVGPHQKLADKFVSMIPGSVPVSTQDQLDPHLSSRRFLYLLEDTGRIPPLQPANYILLDVSAPTYPLPSYQLFDRAMQWIQTPGWGVVAANDGLILIAKGARSHTIPQSFYTFVYANASQIKQRLNAGASGLNVVGLSEDQVDLPNHPVPSLAFTIYLRIQHRLTRDLQPVVYQIMDGQQIGCTHEPLGLSWLPTSRWQPGITYAVRLQPLETTWQTPGTAELRLGLAGSEGETMTSVGAALAGGGMAPIPGSQPASCTGLWSQHGPTWRIGTQDIQY